MKVRDTSRWLALRPYSADRLSSLPDELLDRILSRLSIKDVAVIQVLSKKMSRRAFSVLTTVNFDYYYSPHCPRYLLYVSFVDHVLQKLSTPLSRFRLHLAVNREYNYCPYEIHDRYPHLSPSRLNSWISYPLHHVGLTELDLRIHVTNPSDHQIPPALFSCRSLRVLKLDSNLKLDGAEIPLISLPNLNLLHLLFLLIVDDAFIPRLISTSPFLEDLMIHFCWWVQSHRLSISSPSLKRLELCIMKCDEELNSDLVLIDTPNLEYFYYLDNMAHCYSVTYMSALVQAIVVVEYPLQHDPLEKILHLQLGLVRMLSNATHLSLLGRFVENMYLGGELKNQIPVFRNLKILELCFHYLYGRWNEILTETLLCTPNLETLVFPQGFDCRAYSDTNDIEDDGLLFTETTPQCLLTHLKRLLIKEYFGVSQELNVIRSFLQKASILQELDIEVRNADSDILLLERTLKDIPRASIDCSIRVQRALYPYRRDAINLPEFIR